MRDSRTEFAGTKSQPARYGSLAHTLYIRLEKKCHPKCEVNRFELRARVLRRIYIRDISRHKGGDISCMSPRVRIGVGEEITPKGVWLAVNV
jgi:hypothetical protein